MKKLLLTSTLVATVSFACAKPNYEQKTTPETVQAQNNAQTDCPLQFNASSNCLWWKWEKYPTESESGNLVFKIFRFNQYDQSPVLLDAPSDLEVVLWMPSMGHGSSPTTVRRIDVGTYEVQDVFFVMPGEWEIKFQVKEGITIQDEAVLRLTF